MQAGFEVVAAVDWEPEAMMTYMTNLGSHPINIHYIEPEDKERLNKAVENMLNRQKRNNKQPIHTLPVSGSGHIAHQPDLAPVKNVWVGNVRKLAGKAILDALGMKKGEVDCVCGGPPCQGFSTSGKRDVMDPRNSLVFEYARLILEIWPKTFVMENVPGIVSMVTPEGIPVIDAFCKVLEDGGFSGYDALKKTLLSTAGAGGVLRKKQEKSSSKLPKRQKDREAAQEALF